MHASTIQIKGEKDRPINLHALAGSQLVIWIDTADGLPLANVRLSTEDAETIVATIIQHIATQAINEPSHAAEHLQRVLAATVRALLHGLDTDPRQLIQAIERETP
jgi:hypothetical protein